MGSRTSCWTTPATSMPTSTPSSRRRLHRSVPSLVTAALRLLFDRRDASWPAVAECVVEQPPDAWPAFDAVLAKARTAATLGQEARRELTLKPGLRLVLLASPAGTCFERLENLDTRSPWLAIAERRDSGAIRVAADT